MSSRRIIDDQYEIIRQINVGGFGNIYYGWDLTLDRPVAIKEVVQSLLGEKQYVDMFVDEALNTARLNHANIVQIYSLRKTSDNRVFIIMQYIEGVDLRDVLDFYQERDERIPENMIVHIISEVCKALEYAHNLKDRKTGHPLNIVHRDISPSNVMLTVEGSVKLIDFGIAKARNRVAQKTQTGFVKGKISYMSPEQLEGKDATRQSDIFSLGSVFYELITSQKLFTGDSDFTIMKKIASGAADFSALDTLDLPSGLHDIFKKALIKDLSQRYASSNDMYVDLYQLGREHYPGEPTSELSRLVHQMYVKEPDEPDQPDDAVVAQDDHQDQIKTKILTVIPESKPKDKPAPVEKPAKKPAEKPVQSKPPADTADDVAKTQIFDSANVKAKIPVSDDNAKTMVRDMPFAGDKPKKSTPQFGEISAVLKKVDKRVWMYGGGAIAVIIFLFIIGSLIGGGGSSSGPKGDYLIWINSVPEGAEVSLNDVSYGETPLQLSDIEPGTYTLKLVLDEADPIDTSFVLTADEIITFPNFIMTKEIYLSSIPAGATILIDNLASGLVTPALVKIPIDDSIEIVLEHEKGNLPVKLTGFNVLSSTFTSGENSVWDNNINAENNRTELVGRFKKEIRITTKPQGADIYITGQDESIGQSPGDFLIPFGETRLRLVKAGFKDKIRTINIAENFQGALFYELYREVAVAAVDRANPKGTDLGATIYRIESEGRVSESSDNTPIDLMLTGIEHKIYLRKAGFADTSFVVGVTQSQLKAEMRKLSDKKETSQVVEKNTRPENAALLIFIMRDRKSDEPLEGVDIIAERRSDKKKIHLGVTNSTGRLSTYLEAGKYNFEASLDGYKSWDDGKKIKKNKEYKFDKELKRK